MAGNTGKESSLRKLFSRGRKGETKKGTTTDAGPHEQDFDFAYPEELKAVINQALPAEREDMDKEAPTTIPETAPKAPDTRKAVTRAVHQPTFEPVKKSVWSEEQGQNDPVVSVYEIKDLSGLVLPKSATFEVDELKIKARTQVFDLKSRGGIPSQKESALSVESMRGVSEAVADIEADHGKERDHSDCSRYRIGPGMKAVYPQEPGDADRHDFNPDHHDDRPGHLGGENGTQPVNDTGEKGLEHTGQGGHPEDQRQPPDPAGKESGREKGRTVQHRAEVSRSDRSLIQSLQDRRGPAGDHRHADQAFRVGRYSADRVHDYHRENKGDRENEDMLETEKQERLRRRIFIYIVEKIDGTFCHLITSPVILFSSAIKSWTAVQVTLSMDPSGRFYTINLPFLPFVS